MPVKKKRATRKKVTVREMTPPERHELYFVTSRLAIQNGETDQLIRTIMAAAMASCPDIIPGTVLAQDLTLLRWVLRKMQENRMVAETPVGEQ